MAVSFGFSPSSVDKALREVDFNHMSPEEREREEKARRWREKLESKEMV
nr:hypothetical protein [Candidatus Sigynarchaeota archaeon]